MSVEFSQMKLLQTGVDDLQLQEQADVELDIRAGQDDHS